MKNKNKGLVTIIIINLVKKQIKESFKIGTQNIASKTNNNNYALTSLRTSRSKYLRTREKKISIHTKEKT